MRAYGCRDPDDDVVCGTAVAGRVDYLVTRDDDLKRDRTLIRALQESGVTVVSVSQFHSQLDQSGDRR